MNMNSRLLLVLALMCGATTLLNEWVSAQDSNGQKWGSVKGQIVFAGDASDPERISPTKAEDKKYCDDNKIVLFKEDFVVDKKTKGLAGVFVMMYHGRDAGKGKEVPVHESYEKSSKEKIIVDNNKLRFAPHNVIARVGQEVVLRNSDSVGHNVRLSTGKNAFNYNVPANSDVTAGKMKAAERLPQKLECNMHDWMRGLILIRHEPYNMATDKKGAFEIKNMPVGRHEIQFWHTRYLQLLDKDGKEMTNRRGVMEIEIKDGETLDLGMLTLKENPVKK
jgi:plastocyanin